MDAQFVSLMSYWPVLITALIAGSIYLYFRRKFSYWSDLGLKTPTPIPWFGTALHPLITPKPLLELEFHKNLGKLYGLYDGFMGTSPTLVCGHPEVLKQVTIKHFDSFTNRRKPATWLSIRYRALTYMRDEEWKNMRKILAPTFTSNKLKRMYESMKKCTKNLQDAIEQQGKQEIDLKKMFSVYTVDIISTCCFSMDLRDFRHPDSEILISARKFFNVSKLKMAVYAAIPKTLLAFLGFDINDTDSIDFFARFATEVLNKRRKIGSNLKSGKQDDFLQTLIDAAAEFNDTNKLRSASTENQDTREKQQPDSNDISDQVSRQVNQECAFQGTRMITGKVPITWMPIAHNDQPQSLKLTENKRIPHKYDQSLAKDHEQQEQKADNDDSSARIDKISTSNYTPQQLGDLEILAQSMLFLAVGHETTATTLSSCGMFLAIYPELQDRLYNEVHEAFAEDKGDLSYDRIMKLQYLEAFISETLRFYTPTLTFDREASEDVRIQADGYDFVIPKGMGVVIPFHAIHHDPDNYEDPERFDPERFMPENRHKIKPCTFIPFGSGPRFCLASRFALLEAKLALATLVNRFKFVRSEGTTWPPKFRHHYMLMQMEWPKVKLIDRKLGDIGTIGANGVQMAA